MRSPLRSPPRSPPRSSINYSTAILALLSLWVAAAGCNSQSTIAKRAKPTATTAPSPFTFDAKKTLYFLASDELEGRGIGTAGLDRAADFIADEFKQMGLKPPPNQSSDFQPFEMKTATEIGPKTSLAVDARKFQAKEDFAPVSFSAEGSFAGPVAFAGYGMNSAAHHYDDYAGIDVKGKVVLAMRFEPHDANGNSRFEKDGWSTAASLGDKAQAAADAGAVALLLVTPPQYHGGDDSLVPFARRPMTDAPKIPLIHVRQTVAQELLKRGGAPDLKELQQKIDNNTKPASFELAGVKVSGEVELKQKKASVKNVIAYLPGEIADEYVVVGAHYDHLGRGGPGSLSPRSHEIHNGADDNASGTTAMLELASKLSHDGTPKRSIIFAAFTAEEEGCIGSTRFVEHPPVPLDRITAMINLDMVGRVRSTPASTNIVAPPTTLAATSAPTTQSASGILYVGGSGTAATFDAIIQKADERSPLVLKDIGKGGLGPSDHMSFALKHVPVLFFFSGLHADYHRPTDDADKINYEGLEEVVNLVQDVTEQVAQSPRQNYIVAADAHSMHIGSPSSGTTVTLGVIPDYTVAMDAGGGVKISGTSPNSPAAKAGLKAGDTIVKWDAKAIDTLYDLSDMLARGKHGQMVKLKVMRDGKPIEIQATLATRK
jgi:hypothetical protein